MKYCKVFESSLHAIVFYQFPYYYLIKYLANILENDFVNIVFDQNFIFLINRQFIVWVETLF